MICYNIKASARVGRRAAPRSRREGARFRARDPATTFPESGGVHRRVRHSVPEVL